MNPSTQNDASRSRPVISIVLPLLNAMPYLHDALTSLEAQDVDGLEIIAVDAGSTDGTREMLDAQPNVTVVSAQGSSQTEALNIGFALSSGGLLGWLNGDDFLADGALGWVAKWFDDRLDSKLLYGDSMAINSNGRHYGLRSNVREGQFQQLLHGDFIVQPSAFWRRGVFDVIGPLDESLHFTFDYAFFLDVAKRWQIDYEPVVLSFERLRGGTKTVQGGSQRADELLTVMKTHGHNKVPVAFRPEVSAVKARVALKMLRSNDRAVALPLLCQAAKEGRPVSFALAHFITTLVAGPNGTAQARLLSNWLRTTYRHREPVWPTSSR